MAGRAHATKAREARRQQGQRCDGHIHHAWRRLFVGCLSRHIRQLVATARPRHARTVCQDQLAGRNYHSLLRPVNRAADAIGEVRRPGPIQDHHSGASHVESLVMAGHDGIRRDCCLQITSRMRSAADDGVGIDLAFPRGCGHEVGPTDICRCWGRRRTCGDRVSTSFENDCGCKEGNEAKRCYRNEGPARPPPSAPRGPLAMVTAPAGDVGRDDARDVCWQFPHLSDSKYPPACGFVASMQCLGYYLLR